MMQQPDMQKFMGGQVVLRLLSFIDRLSSPEPHLATKFEFWEEFVAQHFAPGGSLQHQLVNMSDGSDKRFRISYPALAYYYHSHFTSGIKTMTMQPQGAIERPLPMGCHAVLFQRCTFTHIFGNDAQVVSTGTLKVNFDANQKIEYLDIGTTKWVEYVPRLSLTPGDSPDMKSPKLNKNIKKAPPRPSQPQSVAQPRSMVNSNGITNGVMQNLEVGDTRCSRRIPRADHESQMAEALTYMEPLFQYSQNHDNLTPAQALNSLVHETARGAHNAGAGLPQGNFGNAAPQGMQGQRTPGMNGPNQFASPAMQNLGLPPQGSPHITAPAHTPSPAHMHMAGPVAMVHQHSQQGSNLSGSQGASANTSPNVTNKRRRPSGIKLEDDGGGEINGNSATKVKPSPRIGGKRQKGTT
jgi:LIM-domain binding protein